VTGIISSAPDTKDAAFIQRRVGLFGLTAGALLLAFWAFIVLGRWVAAETPVFNRVMLLHFGASVSLLLPWPICGGRSRPQWAVRSAEMASLLAATVMFCVMSLDIALHESPGLVLTSVMSVVLTARAVYVPSSFARSFALALLVGVGIVVAVYQSYLSIDRSVWLPQFPNIMDLAPEQIAARNAATMGVWWLVPGTLTALASKVIYGLRREVRSAKQLGQYHLVRRLGEGGMGRVYEAKHALLRRRTAIKVIKPDTNQEAQLARFEREVQQTASLAHPNIVSVYDFGRTQDGVFYYAMELIDGASLAHVVAAGGPQAPARAVHIMRQVARAMCEAHSLGLIHRDLKPANIMLHGSTGVHDVVKVVDFGLVKQLGEGQSDLTRTNALVGTPHYMAPEAVCAPEEVGPASDVYALGCILYNLLTGHEVFSGATIVEVCSHHLNSEPVLPSERLGQKLPNDLEVLVMQCLEKSHTERPTIVSLSETLDALDVGSWSPRDAERWWTQNGEKRAVLNSSPSSSSLRSVEIHGITERL